MKKLILAAVFISLAACSANENIKTPLADCSLCNFHQTLLVTGDGSRF